jgi:hypothetical protein
MQDHGNTVNPGLFFITKMLRPARQFFFRGMGWALAFAYISSTGVILLEVKWGGQVAHITAVFRGNIDNTPLFVRY